MRLLAVILVTALTLPAAEVVEEIVAKVNGEIITKSELERQRQNLRQETAQQYGAASPQFQTAYTEREKDLLRELIDQTLLLQRGREMNLNVEIDVVKQLDRIRERAGLPTLEALERAVVEQGGNWEDFRANIRNNIITQRVIGQEVSRTIQMPHERLKKYYDEHKEEFNRPEQVRLREIFVSTEGKEGADLAAAEKKTRELLEKVRKGANFAQVAREQSEGSTAKERDGDLGFFSRGQLAKEIEDVAFSLKKGEVSDVIRTKYGWLFIKVEEKHSAGIPPLEEVEQEIQEKLYVQEMQPAMRQFLAKLREEAYIEIKDGYVDTGAAGNPDYARFIPKDMTEDELLAPKGKQGGRSWLPPFRRKKN